MSIRISSSTINKLGHDILEIRVRTLKHIEGRITRALLQHEPIMFNSGCLIKQLIRWFGLKPLSDEEVVLNLMITILTSKYMDDAIKFLGLQRLKKEVGKIYELVKSSSSKKLVCDIKDILDKYIEPLQDDDDDNDTDTVIEITSSSKNSTSTNCLYSEEDIIDDEFSPDYEKPWSTPSVPDYNSLKYLCDSLTVDSNQEELKHAFKYLYTAMNDYPAEYFLQPPYIFKALLVLHTKDNQSSECLFRNFIKLTKSILGRVEIKRLAKTYSASNQENKLLRSKTQITVSRYCVELFNLCLQRLKEPNEDTNQDESFLNFSLLFEVLNLMESDTYCYIPKESILMDLAYIAKYYRQSLEIDQKPNRIDRVRYMIIIYLMVKVVDFRKQREVGSAPKTTERLISGKDAYNPNNYFSISANESKNFFINNNESDVWYMELENALLDIPLQKFYPQLYENIKKAIKLETRSETATIRILLNCEKMLIPVVKLLRQPDDFSDEEFIFSGLEALETLSIFQSLDFVKKLIHAISSCIPLFDGNDRLKEAAECVILRLFSHENLKIKRLTYKETANSMKHFFGRLMEGEITLDKMYKSELRAKTLGVPLNVEILSEIICFGCQHSDLIIRLSAETMIYLIIRGKTILGAHWESFLELLLPNFPLIQCLQPKDSGLGLAILNLLDPDNDFPVIDMIQGNLRFLFFDDITIRSEALSRIIYILSSHSESQCYVPNVLQISDTLPNDICILNTPKDPEMIFSGGLYDRSTVSALLELLKCPDVEPSVRKTTLLQLNVVCQDPELVELIYSDNGWYLALQALDNSLKINPVADYPDSAIPAIGIISKIGLCIPQFRREVSNEGNLYFLLVRALFLFHNDIVLQQDCALILFLLVFSSYAIGSKQITLPKICSRIKLPIKCDFHWIVSPFEQKSLIEEIFFFILSKNESSIDSPRERIPLPSSSQSSSIITIDLCKNQIAKLNEKSSPKINGLSEPRSFIQNSVLQFLRLTFACIWFDGLELILEEFKKAKDNQSGLDYSILPPHLHSNDENQVITILEKLNFNKHLELTSDDLLFIKYSSATENIRAYLKRITNATNVRDVTVNVARIKLCLMLSTDHHVESKEFLNTFRRFLLMVPNNRSDKLIFESTVDVMTQLLEANDPEILQWILEDIQDTHCVMLLLLKNYECGLSLYIKVCDFLKVLMNKCICERQKESLQKYIVSKDATKKGKEFYNIFNRLFEYIIPITEECFHKRHLDQVRFLLSLLYVISRSQSVELDSGLIPLIVKKLFYFIMTLKSFTQAGSHLTKNCLFIIGNIINDVDEFVLEENYVRFLSGICGHADFQIRALSWNILSKMCKCFKGAHLVVKELSFLPGGFHACCLSTFLDPQEVPIVRETAGGVFSNLLTYPKSGCDEGLHIAVAPLCIELDPDESNGIELFMQVISKHRFLQTISSSLEYFHISDFIYYSSPKEIITCGIVKIFCSILINWIDLQPSMVDKLAETSALLRILGLIKCVPTCITKSSLEMTSEICNLLLRLIQPESKFLQRTISRDQELIVVLISLLNPLYFENQDKTSLIAVMQVLKTLANESVAFQLICEIISSRYFSQVCLLLCSSLAPSENQEYQKTCLKFIISLLVKGQTEEFRFETFSHVLDTTKINEERLEITDLNEFKVNNKRRCASLENVEANSKQQCTTKNPTKRSLGKSKIDYMYASEMIFWKIKVLFEANFSTKNLKRFENTTIKKIIICEALSIILKTSSRARRIAREINFLQILIGQLDFIFGTIGITCTEFIRKHGDSKKDPIIQELTILYGIILNWFSSDCLTHPEQILELTKIFIQSWPWICHSNELRTQFIKCLAHLSEDSVPVCKQFSTTISNYSHSILQLTANMITAETNKIKHPNIDFTVLEVGLRLITNCCCCIEGRLQLVKINILDVFNKFHPSSTKMQKSWNILTFLWLKFWDIFSRYAEGAVVRHLVLICTLIVKANSTIKNLSLSVLRNMAFVNANRAALLSSQDFLYIVNSVLSDGSYEEQFLVTTTVWRLIADNYKAKHVIKGTSIPKKLNCILKKTSNSNVEPNDLLNIIEILLKVLND